METKQKKHPAAIQALLDVLAAEQAKVAAMAASEGRASDVSTDDVESARILAEVAAGMIPKAAKATADEKALAKAIGTVNSLALAIGDRRAKRVPQPASILGYKMLAGASKAREAEIITTALGELAIANKNVGRDLSDELVKSDCVIGKSGNLTKSGVKGAKPAAKAWRALTGSAAAASILTAETVLALGQALGAKTLAAAA